MGREYVQQKRLLRRLGDCGHQNEIRGEVPIQAYRSRKSQVRLGQQDSRADLIGQ